MKNLVKAFGYVAQETAARWEDQPASTSSRNLVVVWTTALLVLCVCLFSLTGCGNVPTSTPPTVATARPSFLAYGIEPDTSFPVDTHYPVGCPACSTSPIYMQPLDLGVVTVLKMQELYYGTSVDYDTANSSFRPQTRGLYYVDTQVQFRANTTGNTHYTIQLNLNGVMYLPYAEDTSAIGTDTAKKMQINALMCLNGSTDHVETVVSVSGNVSNARVASQDSQFEAYYVGPCPAISGQ